MGGGCSTPCLPTLTTTLLCQQGCRPDSHVCSVGPPGPGELDWAGPQSRELWVSYPRPAERSQLSNRVFGWRRICGEKQWQRKEVGSGGRGLVGSMSSLQPSLALDAPLTPELVVNLRPPFPGGGRGRARRAMWEETSGAREKGSHPDSALVRTFRKHPPSLGACWHHLQWISDPTNS